MADSFWSGQGGHMIVDGVTFPVGDWKLGKKARLAEVTRSNSGGAAKWKKVLKEGDWSCSTPWDSDQPPEAINLSEGDEVDELRFILGESGDYMTLPGIVESIDVVVDSKGDVVRLSISGKANGLISGPISPP